jgi:hypothetical protein
MDLRPSSDRDERPLTILGRLSLASSEDPFGQGDPLEVARLVRRSLAAAGRRAVDVTRLVVVADAPVASERLSRFVRRALGPHAAGIVASVVPVAGPIRHEDRIDLSSTDPTPRSVTILVVMGPAQRVTVLCVTPSSPDTPIGAGGRT